MIQTPTSDPLEGWKLLIDRESEKLDQAVKDDYRAYIQKFLSKKHYYIDDSNIWFFENKTGEHAVKIEIPSNGTWLAYVLIYDKENKRIKVIKSKTGRYRS
jgi:hypothetical protein